MPKFMYTIFFATFVFLFLILYTLNFISPSNILNILLFLFLLFIFFTLFFSILLFFVKFYKIKRKILSERQIYRNSFKTSVKISFIIILLLCFKLFIQYMW